MAISQMQQKKIENARQAARRALNHYEAQLEAAVDAPKVKPDEKENLIVTITQVESALRILYMED